MMIGDILMQVAGWISAAAVVFGVIFGAYRWILRQNQQDQEIKALKVEQTVICYGVLAALKGLHEKGCNGPVTDAIGTLEKHLNKQAHK